MKKIILLFMLLLCLCGCEGSSISVEPDVRVYSSVPVYYYRPRPIYYGPRVIISHRRPPVHYPVGRPGYRGGRR